MADQPVIVEKGSGTGPIVGIVAVVVLLVIAYFAGTYFGARPANNTTNVNVPTPSVNVTMPTNAQ